MTSVIIFAIDCTKIAQQNETGVCIECVELERTLIQRLHNKVKLREGRLDPNLNDTHLMVSPGLMQNKLKNQKKRIVMLSKRLERQRLETQKMAQLAHHQINLMVKD